MIGVCKYEPGHKKTHILQFLKRSIIIQRTKPRGHIPLPSPIVGRFVGTVVEDLEELGAAKVEHELGVEGELLTEPERIGIILVELSKLLTLEI